MRQPRIQIGDIVLTTVTVLSLFLVLSARTTGSTVPLPVPAPLPSVEIPKELPLPVIEAEVLADPENGWNVLVRTDDFRLLPDGTEEGVASGYAYVSLDNGPATRLYSAWIHLPAVPDGKHTLRLHLADDNFHPYVYGGDPVFSLYDVTMKSGNVEVEKK